MHPLRQTKRFAAACVAVATLAGGAAIVSSSSADVQGQLQANKSAAVSLQAQVNAETHQIQQTAGGVAAAQRRLADVQAQLQQHVDQLREVQTRVMSSRDELLRLEHKLHTASDYLAANLRAEYENGSPNLVDVILNSHGFSNLLNEVNYIKDAQHQDAEVVDVTKITRIRVQHEAISLGRAEARDRDLTDQILSQRTQASAIESALVQRQIDEESQRSHTRARLASVNSHTAALQKKLDEIEAAAEAAARQTPQQVNQQVGGLAIDTGGMVQPPPGAPQSVDEMIAAGNAIATLPYIWGGGHGSFISPGYDCSGSVSYVLAAAGLLSAPEVSGSFESYGEPGAGQWVTIYANAGHVWMDIAGWRFDTVALAESGTRWSRAGGEFGGFVVRHPVAL